MDSIKQLFKYKISTLVCAGEGPHAAKAIIKKFLDYRKTVACHCGSVNILNVPRCGPVTKGKKTC